MKSSQKLQKELVCRLTTEEKSEFGRQLADLTQRKERLEDAKKSTASRYKAEIDSCQTDINELSGKITLGSELRLVDCEIRFNDPRPGVKTTYRLDTGEVVTSGSMTNEDMQGDLFDGEAENADESAQAASVVEAEVVEDPARLVGAETAPKALPMHGEPAPDVPEDRVMRNAAKLSAAGITPFIEDGDQLRIRIPQFHNGRNSNWRDEYFPNRRSLKMAVARKLADGWVNAADPMSGRAPDCVIWARGFAVCRVAHNESGDAIIQTRKSYDDEWRTQAPRRGSIDDPDSPAGREWQDIVRNPKVLEV